MASIPPMPAVELMPLPDLAERRPVALVASGAAWDAVQGLVRLDVVWRYEPLVAEEDAWLAQAAALAGDVVYAVGGGLAVDTAKYLAARRGLPLVCIPTALSVDAFFSPGSGLRRDGCLEYLPTKPPDCLIVDLDVIAAAPPAIRAAGVCDLLSIATGSWDWRLADTRGRNAPETPYLSYVDRVAQGILQGTLDCAEAAGRGDPGGLRQLLDCLAVEVALCNQIGHSRPEEGSEHYLAYAVEDLLGYGMSHGELVGPGIALMAAIQGQDVGPLLRAMRGAGVPLDRIPAPVMERALRGLPDYVRRHNLAYSIAHELTHDSLRHIDTLWPGWAGEPA